MGALDYFTFEKGTYNSDYMEKNDVLYYKYRMSNSQITWCIPNWGNHSPYGGASWVVQKSSSIFMDTIAESNKSFTMEDVLNKFMYKGSTGAKRVAAYFADIKKVYDYLELYQITFAPEWAGTIPRGDIYSVNYVPNCWVYEWRDCKKINGGTTGSLTDSMFGGWLPSNDPAHPPFYYYEKVKANFPILETYNDWLEFITADEPDWTKVLNPPADIIFPVFSDFYANASYNITTNGEIGTDIIRFQKFRQKKPNSTYLFLDKYSESLNNLSLYVDANIPLSRIYHNDGTGYIADSEIVYSDFPNTGQKEINQSIYNIKFRTNIPIFSDEEDATKYIEAVESKDEESIEDALQNAENYDYITNKSNDYNPIGQEVDTVVLNDGYSRQAFTTLLAMDYTALSEINNKVFDSQGSFIDAILNGLKLYGATPIEAVISLNYLPFDISEVATSGSQNHVNFGSYVLNLENAVYNVQNARCVIDMGSVIFSEQTGSWLDFEPVTEMYIWLPYIGINKLDISKYYLKTIKLEYIVDLNTSACTAVLSGNNVILDYFDGNIGVNMPITGYNNGEYANAVLNATMQTVKGGVGALATAPSGKISADTLSSLGQFESGLFALTQTINANHMYIKGSASSGVGMCQPQYPIIYVIKNEIFEPENLHQLVGYPSSFGGKVKNCSGYLQCSDVKLTSTATDKEKEQIIALLKSGIYV